MLEAVTTKRIDDYGDILAGEVPDTKSRAEQITISPTYKFIDDMVFLHPLRGP